MKFGPNTKIHLECNACGNKETIFLKDLPHTLGGHFILLSNGQCADCLGIVTLVVRLEDIDHDTR